jgi:GNAT superfamily N-acetyltransferase
MKHHLRPARADECDFAFEVKRDAMGDHIRARWQWDEEFQRNHHAKQWREKPWFIICTEADAIGTVSLQWSASHLQFGEFYLLGVARGQGTGSAVLREVLLEADDRKLETRLEYLKWNPVGRLYARHGFQVVSESEIHFFAVRNAIAA